jgi:hypothetical protein
VILRPEFTLQLAKLLLGGASINLISPHGQGRRRTVKDLRAVIPSSLTVQYIDLRLNPDDLQTTVSGCLQQQNTILLIVHNFNLLQNDVVIERLNSIKNISYISLLCISENAEDQPSLNAENIYLPPLTQSQLIAEINYRGLAAEVTTVDRLLTQPVPYSALDQLTG